MWSFLIAGAVWAPFAFFLHCILHESAHALFAKLNGATSVSIWPFPGFKTGRFTWAHVTWVGPLSSSGKKYTYLAPVLFEFVWFSLVFCVLLFVPFGWWLSILFVELASSVVDITTWTLPFFRKDVSELADANIFLKVVGGSREKLKVVSLVGLIMLSALIVVAIINKVFVFLVVS